MGATPVSPASSHRSMKSSSSQDSKKSQQQKIVDIPDDHPDWGSPITNGGVKVKVVDESKEDEKDQKPSGEKDGNKNPINNTDANNKAIANSAQKVAPNIVLIPDNRARTDFFAMNGKDIQCEVDVIDHNGIRVIRVSDVVKASQHVLAKAVKRTDMPVPVTLIYLHKCFNTNDDSAVELTVDEFIEIDPELEAHGDYHFRFTVARATNRWWERQLVRSRLLQCSGTVDFYNYCRTFTSFWKEEESDRNISDEGVREYLFEVAPHNMKKFDSPVDVERVISECWTSGKAMAKEQIDKFSKAELAFLKAEIDKCLNTAALAFLKGEIKYKHLYLITSFRQEFEKAGISSGIWTAEEKKFFEGPGRVPYGHWYCGGVSYFVNKFAFSLIPLLSYAPLLQEVDRDEDQQF